MLEVVVINLDQATERMAFQKKQLDALGIKFSRLSANAIDPKEYFEKYKSTWERPLSLSEVSLFFNHKKIWQMIVEENKPMLILEDDAYLTDTTPTLLKEIEKLENVDYLNIEARGNNQKKIIANKAKCIVGNTSILRLYQGRSGTGGYVLWPSGAKKLLDQVAKGKIGIVDKFINANYQLKAYQCEPAALIQLDKCEHYGLTPPIETQSYIEAKSRSPVKPDEYWTYKLARIKGQVKIAFNHLRHFSHSTKRAIGVSEKSFPKIIM